jgi:hypothetical protein
MASALLRSAKFAVYSQSVTAKKYARICITEWSEFRELVQNHEYWVYRGHSNVDWSLQTTLERVVAGGVISGQLHQELETREAFYQRAHHYIAAPPRDEERLEWAALLRHHGGPSRLLDVTASPYVAAYFALEESTAGKPFAVLAIHALALHAETQNKVGASSDMDFRTRHGAAEAILRREKTKAIRGVVWAEPKRINERMAAQQGSFLVPGDLTVSFEENLQATLGDPEPIDWSKATTRPHRETMLMKIEFPWTMQRAVQLELNRMNISAATLYPGLDGFARSLTISARLNHR